MLLQTDEGQEAGCFEREIEVGVFQVGVLPCEGSPACRYERTSARRKALTDVHYLASQCFSDLVTLGNRDSGENGLKAMDLKFVLDAVYIATHLLALSHICSSLPLPSGVCST
jgi:hypothetical protein